MPGTMSVPLFPKLLPRVSDSLWFNVDKPCDDEHELSKLEEEHQEWLRNISTKDSDIIPIGKTAAEHFDDDDEEEDEDGDDESDTNDDELDTDMIDDRDSPDDNEMDTNDPTSESPPWGV